MKRLIAVVILALFMGSGPMVSSAQACPCEHYYKTCGNKAAKQKNSQKKKIAHKSCEEKRSKCNAQCAKGEVPPEQAYVNP